MVDDDESSSRHDSISKKIRRLVVQHGQEVERGKKESDGSCFLVSAHPTAASNDTTLHHTLCELIARSRSRSR